MPARPISLGALRQVVSDGRFNISTPVFIRIVNKGYQNDDGSYAAVEIPIVGGMTGWKDGHASILAETDLLLGGMRKTDVSEIDYKYSRALGSVLRNEALRADPLFYGPHGEPLSVESSVHAIELAGMPPAGLLRLSDGVTYKITVEPVDEFDPTKGI